MVLCLKNKCFRFSIRYLVYNKPPHNRGTATLHLLRLFYYYRKRYTHFTPVKWWFVDKKNKQTGDEKFLAVCSGNQTELVNNFLSLFTTIPREIGYNIKKKKTQKQNSDEKFSTVLFEKVSFPKIIRKQKQKQKHYSSDEKFSNVHSERVQIKNIKKKQKKVTRNFRQSYSKRCCFVK